MFYVNYEFQPGENVFVVIDGTRIESGLVLTVKFKVYEDDIPSIVTAITYTVLLDDAGEGTAVVESTDTFRTLAEAAYAVSGFFTPTVTPDITPTITTTPTITPTISVTPDITPTTTTTPTVTPNVTITATITPTASLTPPPTPAVTTTPSAVFSQKLLLLEDNVTSSLVSEHILSTQNVLSSTTQSALSSNLNMTGVIIRPSGFFVNGDGTILVVLDNSDKSIHKYNLSDPWKVNSGIYSNNSYQFNIASHHNIKEVTFNPTGTRVFILHDNGSDQIHQHDLGSAWDLATISPTYVTYDIDPERTATGMVFGGNGYYLYTSGSSTLHVSRITLASPYDISVIVSAQSFFVEDASSTIEGISLSASGGLMFLLVDGIFNTYTLPLAWDILNPVHRGAIGIYNPSGIGQARSFILETL